MRLRGVGGTLPVSGKGTFAFNFLDDNGKTQQLKVENAYYVPRLKLRLFSPQQWSQQGPMYRDGTFVRGELTCGDTTKLFFKGGTKTIPQDTKTGLPLMHSAPGYNEFGHFVTSRHLSTCEARVLPTANEFEEMQVKDNIFKDIQLKDLSFNKVTTSSQQQLQTLENATPKDRLLQWHYRLGHLPFSTLKNMAKQKIIDPTLAKVEPPMCTGCNYGQQSRRARRTKPNKKLRRRRL